ncbi:hypothetical protein GCM10027062_27790 [Nocardioides hungaricus]
MSQRTLWEEGREPSYQVVALGLALALTAIVLDQAVSGRVGILFDVCFVLICVATALAVRPSDFFTVGVLPPLLMGTAFTVLGVTRPDVIADATDGVVQAVVSGLGRHAGALVIGYLLCLAILAVRYRVIGQAASKRAGSPAPTRTTSG